MSQAVHLRKYGVQTTIEFELYEIDGVDLRTDWTPAQSDCEIEKNEGGYTICDNTASGTTTYKIVLTATEMEFARGGLKIVDSATKVFLDKIVYIETYGNASAMHAFDLGTASAAQTADNETRLATIETDTNEIQGKLPTNKFMGSSDGADDDGTLNTIATDTTTDIPALIATAQSDLDTITGASGVLIDTDAVDADAIKTDAVDLIWANAMSDLATGAPSATASVLTAINYLYEAWRNKITTTATLITLMKDDGSTDLTKSTISDDATTFTKAEFVSG